MTGPEHYSEAEDHLETAVEEDGSEQARYHLAAAQVHATLALAAATASAGRMGNRTSTAWDKATGVQR
ncbi:hypothetical protein [Amycolatopsis sp. NPDC059021]|uniref:hypothetical protein n=1 Tax=Amycolatopsis sp. NPDC059021 TaxID=3346704 RepID=UPI00366B61B0